MLTKWTFHAGGALCGLLLSALPVAVIAQTPEKMVASPKAEEVSGTARLNAEQAAKSRREAEAYEARVQASQQAVEQGQEEFAIRTEVYEDDKARAAQHAADVRLKWEADVIACKAGDKTRCGTAEPMHRVR